MIDLGNRQILEDGTVICSESAAVDILYQGKDLTGVVIDSEVITSQFNKANEFLDQGFEQLINSNQGIYGNCDWFSAWLTPKTWSEIDVKEYCLDRCTTVEQRDRVCFEMELFVEHNMIPVLKHLIWTVAYFREHNIVWGVGRGSAVSSYVLYLIGIIRIDPMRYNLDVREFLR